MHYIHSEGVTLKGGPKGAGWRGWRLADSFAGFTARTRVQPGGWFLLCCQTQIQAKMLQYPLCAFFNTRQEVGKVSL